MPAIGRPHASGRLETRPDSAEARAPCLPVRVELQCQLLECLLHLVLAGAPGNPQNLMRIHAPGLLVRTQVTAT